MGSSLLEAREDQRSRQAQTPARLRKLPLSSGLGRKLGVLSSRHLLLRLAKRMAGP